MRRHAYAKINLILDVLNKREDGYHNINFLMTTIDLFDEVSLEEHNMDDDAIEVYTLDNNNKEEYWGSLSNENNLAFKALKLMKNIFNIKKNYKIKIIKKIPIAAGLAGGSTDAAAILHLVNDMEKLDLSLNELANIGITLGSDIYFCIYSKLSIVRGKGDELELVVQTPPPSEVLVVNPKKELSTKKVYDNYKFEDIRKKPIEEIVKINNYEEFYGNLRNDLEKVSKNLEPKIGELEKFILNSNINVEKILVSGSGPTLLIFAKSKNLKMLKDTLKKEQKYKEYYISIHKVQY